MENGSLANVIKKFGSLTESLTAIYVTQVLRGLKYLHDQGVLHRDIKGANILTSKDGYVLVFAIFHLHYTETGKCLLQHMMSLVLTCFPP